MRYADRDHEIFGWNTEGRPIPLLCSDVIGEARGDQAVVNGSAMQWDGNNWTPLPWRDFALWRKLDDPS
jgi:hypothetical protein